ncbi:DUF1772 domain-containing protein [Micromonospora sp. NPDC004551]|uniref:DUF1772 domain-containing protein n=1 Tax=Micromonospora sp. NPDC004551 TaxID=3154284 RepID=UPI0033AE0DAD
MPLRIIRGLALLSTGTLSGTFVYGAVNVAQTFHAVPLDVRLTFHSALMRMNGPVVQTMMALAVLSSVLLVVLSRGVPRLLAAGAGLMALTSFLVTRFGNVPINQQIKVWAVTSAPADHAAILHRWDIFNYVRTAAGVVAFLLVIAAVDQAGRLTAPRPRNAP